VTSETSEEVLFEGNPAVLPTFGAWVVALLTLGLAALYYWARAKSTHYRVTTQRVVVEKGLFSKRMDQIDTYRINDYVIERPFAQRLVGTGNLLLSALDRSNPDLRIDGLKTDVTALYERLRKASEEEKVRRGVRLIDTEDKP
jgi:hypothetical protein